MTLSKQFDLTMQKSKLSSSLSKMTKDQTDFETFLASSQSVKNPRPINSGIVVFKATRAVGVSPIAQTGAQSGHSEDVTRWIRSAQKIEDADSAFWSKNAPQAQRMWNDPNVKDDEFAADHEIVDYRQTNSNKRYMN